jgi:hypothetical protein
VNADRPFGITRMELESSATRENVTARRWESERGTPHERIRALLLAEPERYSWRHILVAALLTRR